MTNEVTPFGGGNLPMDPSSIDAALSNVQQHSVSSQTHPILKLHKNTGLYFYGADDTRMQQQSCWAMNVLTCRHGWTAWAPGQLLDEVLVDMQTAPPPLHDLTNYGVDEKGRNYWKKAKSVLFECLTGEDIGVVVDYKGTSFGMHQAFSGLFDAVVKQRQGPQAAFFFPVVQFFAELYKHPQWGDTWSPVIHIVDWMDENRNLASGGPLPAPTPVAAAPLPQAYQLQQQPTAAVQGHPQPPIPQAQTPVPPPQPVPQAQAPVTPPPQAQAPVPPPQPVPEAQTPVPPPQPLPQTQAPAGAPNRRMPPPQAAQGTLMPQGSGTGLPPKEVAEAQMAGRRRQAQ